MAVANGQEANANTFNGAFLSRTINTSTVGTLELNNTSDINSGAQILNTQRAINEIFDAVGMSGEGDAGRNTYTSNNIVTDGQDRRQAIGALDAAFDGATGHDHDGSNSAQVSASNLLDINQFKAEWAKFSIVEKQQLESFAMLVDGTGLDNDGNGFYYFLGGGLGYVWFNVTDGAFTQTDPAAGGVQVDVLAADTAAQVTTKTKAAIDAAAISGITSTSIDPSNTNILYVLYDVGDITDGNAGDAPVIYTLVINGSGLTQVESWSFIGFTGTDYDVAGAGLKFNLADSAGYVWFNVTDGANAQSDPTGTGTGVQVDILDADDDATIATKTKAALDAAALGSVTSTTATASLLTVNYIAGDLTDGDAGTSPAFYVLVRDGVDGAGVSGTETNVNGFFLGKAAGGSEASLGVVTTIPNNRVDIRDYETETYIEDAEGQKVYGRLTQVTGEWTLSFYTNEAGVETPHSLSPATITVYYREVFDLDTIPTFGIDAGVLGTLDLTNDIVYATEDVAGKILLSNVVAESIGSANAKGVSTRSARADHVHRGISSIQESAEAIEVYGDVVFEGLGGLSVSRSGQTFQFSAVSEPEVEYRTLTAGEETAKALTLSATPLTASKVMVDVIGGTTQQYSVDYTVSGTSLSWSGLGLDGTLGEGDKIRVVYWS